MKKLTFLLSALALLGLASCTEPAEINPNYDAVKNEVTTAFTINIATNAKTKATATEVQDGTAFRGMQDMTLFVATDHPAGVELEDGYKFDLGTLSANVISESQSSKTYSMSIPLGVNNMVFYGRAATTVDANSSVAQKVQYGYTGYNAGETKADIHFDLKKYVDESVADHEGTIAEQFGYRATVLAAIVNDVMSANGWAEYAARERSSIPPYGYPLWDAYNELTSIQNKEHRAGSGPSIVRMFNDLRSICAGITGPGSIVPDGDEARNVANGINAKIAIYIDTDNGSYTFYDMTGTNGLQNKGVLASGEAHEAALKLVTGDLREFPHRLGLPYGAAQFTWNATDKKFEYVTEATVMGPLKDGVGISAYAFPVELCYWVCSPIRVTSESVADADFPKTVAGWDSGTDGQSGTNLWTAKSWVENGTVGASTRGVALKNNINYGTAVLKTTVKFGDGTIKDNRKEILDRRAAIEGTTNTEGDQEFTAAQLANNITLTGILVGGQPDRVAWNWAPAQGATYGNVIYDTHIGGATGTAVPNTSAPGYTMVFDNLVVGKETADQNVVNIALEFKNGTGSDFYGNANLVRDGGYFYLVGQLDLSNLTDAQKDAIRDEYPVNTDENGYRYPPLKQQHTDAGGSASEAHKYDNHQVLRVFMQDFMTEANFTINSLKNAYTTVPDLRAVEMKFGLSVDLVWKKGASFDVPLD